MKTKILQISIFILLVGVYFLTFISSFSKKGSFYMDEPAIVMSSLSGDRSIYAIFKDAAGIAQPPLEHVLREKLYQPIGDNLGVSRTYPEFFHRFLSLLWWLLPIGYFSVNLSNFSNKRRYIIFLSFLFIISSDFLRFYLSEARHYSAIAATFATMIVVLLSDRLPIYKLRYHFLVVSLFPPLLHLISFPYYFALVVYFFYRFAKESYKQYKIYFFDMITLFSVYIMFLLWIYSMISSLSSQWQNSGTGSVDMSYLDSRLKWTLDWIFYGSPFYFFFKVVPSFIKDHLTLSFGSISIYLLFNLKKNFFRNKLIPDITSIFPLIISFVWPLTISLVISKSGMFSGERYSIAILVMVFIGLSSYITNKIWQIKNLKTKRAMFVVIILVTLFYIFINILPVKNFELDSDENKFVRENISILMNNKNYLISDNGSYSTSISMLSIINKVPFNINYIMCRWGTFYSDDGENTINQWLSEHPKDNVYFLTTGKALSGNNKIIWSSGREKLYLIKSIDTLDLCNKNDYLQISQCYVRCTIGENPDADMRSIPGVAPHVDITRN